MLQAAGRFMKHRVIKQRGKEKRSVDTISWNVLEKQRKRAKRRKSDKRFIEVYDMI